MRYGWNDFLKIPYWPLEIITKLEAQWKIRQERIKKQMRNTQNSVCWTKKLNGR